MLLMKRDFHGRIKAMEEGRDTTKEEAPLNGGVQTTIEPRPDSLPATEFVKVEKNLASLGFFRGCPAFR